MPVRGEGPAHSERSVMLRAQKKDVASGICMAAAEDPEAVAAILAEELPGTLLLRLLERAWDLVATRRFSPGRDLSAVE